jgi:hypothetical protein
VCATSAAEGPGQMWMLWASVRSACAEKCTMGGGAVQGGDTGLGASGLLSLHLKSESSSIGEPG